MAQAGPTDGGAEPPGAGSAGGSADPTSKVSALDGGVSRRLSRRCRAWAGGAAGVAGALLLVVVLRPWDVVGAALVMLAAIASFCAAVLAARGTLWAAIARAELPIADGRQGTVGPPRPLSPARPGAPLRRRLGAWVVPVRAADGPQPGAGALVVHSRSDGVGLVSGDRVRIWLAGRGGPVAVTAGVAGDTVAPGRTAPGDPAGTGRFVMLRESDGEVFLGTTRLSDTW